MSIARYDLTEDCTTGKVDITPVPETMEGRYVSYEDYAALEAKCAALAAENAGLKAAAEFATAPDMWEELGGNVMRYQYQEWYADKLKSAIQIPATDAFLAEVRAQGVEVVITYHRERADEKDIKQVRDFAAQLRQEAAQ